MADWIGCGDEYFEAGEYAKALECYAKVNFAPYAFERMGWIYENGLGVEKDLIRAACLYGKAAGFNLTEYPDRETMAGLGRILDQVEWKELADADGGHTFWVLGCLYGTGWGVEKDAEKALQYYLRAAEAGNEQAMRALGEICEEAGDFEAALGWYEQAENFSMLSEFWWAGRGGVQDYDRAFEYLRRDIEADRAGSSPVELGCMYECGLGVEKDLETAVAHYREALEWDRYSADMALWRLKALDIPEDQISAERSEGSGAHEVVEIVPPVESVSAPQGCGEQTVESISAEVEEIQEKWLEREHGAAEQGDTDAMVRLGSLYLTRKGSDNAREAAKWYRKAAELGHADAMAELGKLYEEGRGVLGNEQKAVQWYRKAAENGSDEGMFNLGNACRHGVGGSGDLKEALEWYRRAAELGYSPAVKSMLEIEHAHKNAENGDVDAMVRLGCMYLESGKTADAREALDWFRKAAELGHADAMVHLGKMYDSYELCQGMRGNDEEAVKWYRKAAELGSAEGMFNLGGMYHFGRGVPGDMQEALNWYRKAAELGHADAMHSLGDLYQNGNGVAADPQAAMQWYDMAASHGNAYAMYELGLMYQRGDGMKQDLQKALFWFEQAADAGYSAAKQDVAWLRRHIEG